MWDSRGKEGLPELQGAFTFTHTFTPITFHRFTHTHTHTALHCSVFLLWLQASSATPKTHISKYTAGNQTQERIVPRYLVRLAPSQSTADSRSRLRCHMSITTRKSCSCFCLSQCLVINVERRNVSVCSTVSLSACLTALCDS